MIPRLLAFFILFATAVTSYGQMPKEFVLVDEFGPMPCDDLLSRLDLLAYRATETDSVGLIVVYPGNNVFQTERYVRAINNNSRFRGFPDGLVKIVVAKSTGKLKFHLWTMPSNGVPPVADSPLDYRVSRLSARTLFVDDSLEMFTDAGKDYFASGEACGGDFSLDVLSKVLSANLDLRAEIVINNRKSTNSQKLRRLLLDAAISENRIPRSRFEIILGGPGEAREWHPANSAVKVWLRPGQP